MRRLWLVPVLALVLTGCGSASPENQVRDDVAAVLRAANDGNADAVRSEVEDLLSTLRALVGSRELDAAEAERIRAIALRIAENADLLEPEEEPSPEPEPEPEPEPVATIEVGAPAGSSPTPAQVTQPASVSSPAPAPSPSARSAT